MNKKIDELKRHGFLIKLVAWALLILGFYFTVRLLPSIESFLATNLNISGFLLTALTYTAGYFLVTFVFPIMMSFLLIWIFVQMSKR